MIKNPIVKRFMQETVFACFSVFNKYVKHNNKVILLYSNMGFRDNIKAYFDYLVKNGYNKEYEIICSSSDYKLFKSLEMHNVHFVSNVLGIVQYFRAGYVFYCFGKIPIIPAKNQVVTQFWHGCPFKAPDEGMLKGHSWKKQYYSHVLSTSEFLKDIWSPIFSIPKEKIIVSGFPRNDALFEEKAHFDLGDYDKLVLWTPTFRKSSVMGYCDIQKADSPLPVLKVTELKEVNQFLRNKRVKVVVKLHPLQDLDGFRNTDYDHLVLLSHSEFVSRGMELYSLMPHCDAMISDYSSIFFDYLLLDRPIAFTEDDLEDYGGTRGFVFDNPEDFKPGFIIKTTADFCRFIDMLVNGQDEFKKDRKRVNNLMNDFKEGGYSKRICELLGITLKK